ncbi:HEAT repeat domain-containing protein [Microcoleus sp. B3-D7]|uniref:HEAT repeat domain-containing protein n=1 Tax=Microcoleus sp. B3-D7 TaxID=2818659 RepID=UPI002FD32654
MVDPVSAGVVWLLVGPILQDLAKAALDDYVKDFFKGCIKDVEGLAKKPFAQNAVRDALKAFIILFEQELEPSHLDKKQIQQYLQPLRQFLKQPDVRQVLGTAFQGNCKYLDTGILAQHWQNLRLQHPVRQNLPTFTRIVPANLFQGKLVSSLPDTFSWEQVAEKYLKSVKLIIQQNAELRQILNTNQFASMERSLATIAPIPAEFNLASYQQGLRELYEYSLNLDKLDNRSGEYEEKVTIKEIFIPQNARSCQEYLPKDYELPKEIQKRLRERGDIAPEVRPEDLERYQKAYTQQQTRSVLDVIDDVTYRYLVILGDPGSGKSTLLKYLAFQWAKLSANDLSLHPIHLLIELRKYNRSQDEKKCDNFLEFIECDSSRIDHLDKNILHEWLQAGRAVVMFDGLDEVFELEKRNRIVDQIHSFTQKYPRVKTIVTSRVIGYQQQRLKNAEFHHFMLQDFEPEQIQEFIQKWHDLTLIDRLKKAALLERLQQAIAASNSIRELAGNPLLLTMMAILNRNQELPRFRAKLYEEASKVLLHTWDFEVKEKLNNDRVDPYLIDEEVKQSICGRIAYTMQSSSKQLGNIISRQELRQTITDSLTGLMGTGATACAKLMVDQLRDRNFILCFLGGYNEDYFAFVHRTFLEYFCAWEFVRQFEKQKTLELDGLIEVFREHWRDESWHEVLRLMAGMLVAKFTGYILEYLIGENGEADKFSNLFLAAQCVSEVKNRNEIAAIASQLRDRVKELTKYGNITGFTPQEYNSLVYQIRRQAVAAVASTWKDDPQTLPWLKQRAQSYDNSDVRRAAVEELARGWKDDPETLPILKQLAQSDYDLDVRRAAVEEIARGWKNDPETLPWLKQQAQSDHGVTMREAAVEEIARGWKDDPETLPWLKQSAQSDYDSDVRRAAVQELAQGWKDDPETLPILKQLTQSDDYATVRLAALQELVRAWKDDPETLPILKQLAQSDDGATVRLAALQELVRGWKNDPETLPILKQRAQSDDNWYVPRVAVQEIARGWKDDPETLPWLKQRAQSDDDANVREAAVQELVRGWKDDPEILPIFKQLAQSDDNSAVRQAAVQELARGWKDDPETLPILKQLAQSDDNSAVRQAAVQELARGWKDDPETLPILKQRAQSDDDWPVRQAAVQELARGWKDDPELFELLCEVAINDPFDHRGKYRWRNPRQTALAAMIELYPDRPETLELVRDRAQNDSDEFFREFAQKKLAELERQ